MGRRLVAIVIREPYTFAQRLERALLWHLVTHEHLLELVHEDMATRR